MRLLAEFQEHPERASPGAPVIFFHGQVKKYVVQGVMSGLFGSAGGVAVHESPAVPVKQSFGIPETASK
jgi:hypothetical protein